MPLCLQRLSKTKRSSKHRRWECPFLPVEAYVRLSFSAVACEAGSLAIYGEVHSQGVSLYHQWYEINEGVSPAEIARRDVLASIGTPEKHLDYRLTDKLFNPDSEDSIEAIEAVNAKANQSAVHDKFSEMAEMVTGNIAFTVSNETHALAVVRSNNIWYLVDKVPAKTGSLSDVFDALDASLDLSDDVFKKIEITKHVPTIVKSSFILTLPAIAVSGRDCPSAGSGSASFAS